MGIERNRTHGPVSVACAVLGASPNRDHDHRVRSTRPRRGISNDALLVRMRARGRRKFKATTGRNKLPVAPNQLDRQFKLATPNPMWTSNITYVATDEGWL